MGRRSVWHRAPCLCSGLSWFQRRSKTHVWRRSERKTGLKDVVKPTSGGAPTHLQPSGKQASNPRLAALRHICTPCTPAYLPKTGAEPGWAGPGGTGIRASHLDLLLLLLYINIYTILFHKRYAECAEYAETRESSAEPRFHRAPALASPAYPCTPCTPL